MPINFHDRNNQRSYASREAHNEWIDRMEEHVSFQDRDVVDIGCGGGIYSKAMALRGARSVTGVDFSQEMLQGARDYCKGIDNVTFRQGDALQTGLPSECCDLVLERALIHHIRDLADCFREAGRILKPCGKLLIQDRTPEDCTLPGSPDHLRGYFFEAFPKLLPKETSRRHTSEAVAAALREAGLRLQSECTMWETRRTYSSFDELKDDLSMRTGRSILHELSDAELDQLIGYIGERIGEHGPIAEKDRWTVWIAVK